MGQEIILSMGSPMSGRCCIVTSFLIGWVHTRNVLLRPERVLYQTFRFPGKLWRQVCRYLWEVKRCHLLALDNSGYKHTIWMIKMELFDISATTKANILMSIGVVCHDECIPDRWDRLNVQWLGFAVLCACDWYQIYQPCGFTEVSIIHEVLFLYRLS